MIQPQRITLINDNLVRKGQFVLYWVQAAQRTHYNHALEYAIQKANKLKLPLLAAFAITTKYPQANLRHYHFMFQGLVDLKSQLSKKNIKLLILNASPETAIPMLAQKAALAVVDSGHLRIQRNWRSKVADNIQCPLYEVETNLIVPITQASDKENYSAATLRPRINRQLPDFLIPLKHRSPKISSLQLKIDTKILRLNIQSPLSALKKLDIDSSVKPSPFFTGGNAQAKKLLKNFIAKNLDQYSQTRNDPALNTLSNMSPYLHFGQISPLYIALEIKKSNTPGQGLNAYLEELIIRRELSHNFIYYNNNYDSFLSLPTWARTTLNFHRSDKRPYLYSLEQFELAKTHDHYWNAAQNQMLITGKMHGYMRMYWGKKILEWAKTPRQAFKYALYLNNKYEIDGRGPNAYAGVAWCFGKHDRPWAQRDIFGKVRYMNAAGLKRKFDPEKYVYLINQLKQQFTVKETI